MTEALNYNLTQYTQFRQLEFEYSKTKDQNQQLKARLEAVERMFKETAQEITAQHKKQLQELTDRNQAYEREQRQMAEFVELAYQEVELLSELGLNLDISARSSSTQAADVVKTKVSCLVSCINQLASRSQEQQLNSSSRRFELREDGTPIKKSQIDKEEKDHYSTYLYEQIERLEKELSVMSNEVVSLRRQNADLKLQGYQIDQQMAGKEQNLGTDAIEDNGFSLDMLQYEKEVMNGVFTRIIKCFEGEAICESITDIYQCCQEVIESYREKLQIEYDLEDLEKDYRKEKSSNVNEKLLIELRKQIQSFRKQLHRQKQELTSQQGQLEGCFQELQASNRHDHQMRGYALEVGRKLKEIQKHEARPRHKESRKQPEQTCEPGASRIKFKATSTEELMREAIRKDKQALERVFRESREGLMSQQL